MECIPLEEHHLKDPIRLEIEGADFNEALAAAKAEAKRLAADPMLLAWHDLKGGRFSPPVTCHDEDMPSWLVYALSRGGDITIAINGLMYVFVFRSG